MRYLSFIIIIVLSIQSSYAQINEIGFFAGGSNFIGDIGSTNYIAPNELAFGGIYKWNRSPRHSYRISAIFTDLKGFDSKSDDPRRIQRDYDFSTKIIELSAGMEFTFTDFNLHTGKKVATPYLFTGISIAHHDDYYFLSTIQTPENTSSWAFGIPMALGFKANFLESFVFGIEIGARYTFTDNLDGSYPKESVNQTYKFGNQNNNDWYMFSGITLTYTFGQNPCYCLNY